RIVVWMRDAASAAAITCLCVDEIYMLKTATFGAATAYRRTADGTPEALEEKMQAVWRARGRSAAELGKHPAVVADAMIDRWTTVYAREVGGRTVLLPKHEAGAVAVNEPGHLLMLTADEAV